jgi:poly(beta-D-mannuronate) lyase
MRSLRCLVTVVCSLLAVNAFAATTTVTSISQLQTAINGANPGDTIIVANGSYTASAAISVGRAGTSSAPITITAQSIGGVTISGSGQFSFGGTAAHVIVRGFRFAGSGTLRAALGSHHCRVSRCHFQSGSSSGQHIWFYGTDHEVDYNTFRDKATGGPVITLDRNLSDSHPTHNGTSRVYIHHNYFLNISDPDNSGSETIQTWGGFTRAEYNLFERADGDPEVISSKASDCIYRYNTFRNQVRGRLTLRYARRCTIEGNFFLGAVGLRVYGDGHKIRNNYLENADMPIGDAKSGYLHVNNTEISFNTLVNSPVSPLSGDTPPDSTLRIANNIFQGDTGTLVSVHGNPTYEGNIVWGAAANGTVTGARRVNPQLVRNANGVLQLAGSSPAIDTAAGSYSLPDDQDGQPRSGAKDVGADEVSSGPVTRRILSTADVGPNADLGPTPTPTPTPTSTPAEPTPTPTPTSTPCSGCTFVEITPGAAGVTASTNDGNLPGNAVDNNLATRWSANGDGQWIRFDLGTVRTVSHVSIAVYNGNSRQNRFDLQVSNDGTSWTNVLTNALTSGTTTLEEVHEIDDVDARYVRYLGHTSTSSTFNSVTELSLFTPAVSTATPTPTSTPTPTPTATPTSIPTVTPTPADDVEITPGASGAAASTHDGNLPANAVDNNLATRWSANGDGQWLQLDLGATRTIGSVKIASFNGNTRRGRFDLQVSNGGGVWTNVLTNVETSGTTTAEETFDFEDVGARWVRYLGHGNSDPTKCCWNSVTEMSVWGR